MRGSVPREGRGCTGEARPGLGYDPGPGRGHQHLRHLPRPGAVPHGDYRLDYHAGGGCAAKFRTAAVGPATGRGTPRCR